MYMCILCVRVFAAVVAGNVLLFSVVLFIRGWPYVGEAAMLVRVIILKASSEPHVTVHSSKKRRHMQHVENELAVTVAHYNGGGAFALCH